MKYAAQWLHPSTWLRKRQRKQRDDKKPNQSITCNQMIPSDVRDSSAFLKRNGNGIYIRPWSGHVRVAFAFMSKRGFVRIQPYSTYISVHFMQETHQFHKNDFSRRYFSKLRQSVNSEVIYWVKYWKYSRSRLGKYPPLTTSTSVNSC